MDIFEEIDVKIGENIAKIRKMAKAEFPREGSYTQAYHHFRLLQDNNNWLEKKKGQLRANKTAALAAEEKGDQKARKEHFRDYYEVKKEVERFLTEPKMKQCPYIISEIDGSFITNVIIEETEIERLNRNLEQQQIKVGDKKIRLDQLSGDLELDGETLGYAQLAWLNENRNVPYAFFHPHTHTFSICVLPKAQTLENEIRWPESATTQTNTNKPKDAIS